MKITKIFEDEMRDTQPNLAVLVSTQGMQRVLLEIQFHLEDLNARLERLEGVEK